MFFHLKRILANQHLAQAAAHGMGARRFDAGTRNPGIGIGFANAAQAFVGMNFHNQIVLRRTGGPDIVGGIKKHMTINLGDFHLR